MLKLIFNRISWHNNGHGLIRILNTSEVANIWVRLYKTPVFAHSSLIRLNFEMKRKTTSKIKIGEKIEILGLLTTRDHFRFLFFAPMLASSRNCCATVYLFLQKRKLNIIIFMSFTTAKKKP